MGIVRGCDGELRPGRRDRTGVGSLEATETFLLVVDGLSRTKARAWSGEREPRGDAPGGCLACDAPASAGAGNARVDDQEEDRGKGSEDGDDDCCRFEACKIWRFASRCATPDKVTGLRLLRPRMTRSYDCGGSLSPGGSW